MDTVLSINGLCKGYSSFNLQDITISLEKGTLTGFIGPNGAGKTTTIKSILNMIQPDSGNISVLGLDSQLDEHTIKSRLGVVLDDGHFYDNLTLEKMKSLIAPMFSEWNEHDYLTYSMRFQLPQNKKIMDLSRGMRMKYALTLALSHGAELFILDEPTSGLDPLMRSELLTILTDIIRDGDKTVFMSTHITSDLDRVADYLYFIFNGKILLHGQKDELKEQHAIVKGNLGSLPSDYEPLFIGIHKSAYGFEGLTHNKAELKQRMPSTIVYEVPTIEEIMLYYTRRYQA